jgi:hypothetical protein
MDAQLKPNRLDKPPAILPAVETQTDVQPYMRASTLGKNITTFS